MEEAAKKAKKMKISNIISALLCMVIGIVMIIYPGKSLDIICQVFGVVLIIGGAASLVFFLQALQTPRCVLYQEKYRHAGLYH